MTLNEMAEEAYNTAVQKGWHENGGNSDLENHMLMVTEIAEASSEVINKKPDLYLLYEENGHIVDIAPDKDHLEQAAQLLENRNPLFGEVKIEGQAIELADAMVRIAGYFKQKGWDMDAIVRWKMNYNRTRPYRHGGKAF